MINNIKIFLNKLGVIKTRIIPLEEVQYKLRLTDFVIFINNTAVRSYKNLLKKNKIGKKHGN